MKKKLNGEKIKKDKAKEKDKPYGLFIPAGILIGMGVDFLIGTIPSYLFIGLGIGFLLMLIFLMKDENKKDNK